MKSFRELAGRALRRRTPISYWRDRARAFGRRAVLNLAHSADEIDEVTERQWAILSPKLSSLLNGRERVALDFGCGTGRLSGRLAEAIGGSVIAVDPIEELLMLAPRHPRVEYRLLNGRISMPDASADVVFVCFVLGALLTRNGLRWAVADITRVLRPGGLLFLVENTCEKPSRRHYRFRPEAEYVALFPTIRLCPDGSYEDAGERISIMVGRKASTSARSQS
jgi:SAM-dependent methyltransferase